MRNGMTIEKQEEKKKCLVVTFYPVLITNRTEKLVHYQMVDHGSTNYVRDC